MPAAVHAAVRAVPAAVRAVPAAARAVRAGLDPAMPAEQHRLVPTPLTGPTRKIVVMLWCCRYRESRA